MIISVVDVSKVVGELLDVLVKNEVPIIALDNLLGQLKNDAYIHTIIRNKEVAQEVSVQEPPVKIFECPECHEKNEVVVCSSCNAVITADSSYCSKCGNRLKNKVIIPIPTLDI